MANTYTDRHIISIPQRGEGSEIANAHKNADIHMFQSPRGGKVAAYTMMFNNFKNRFQSPRGGKVELFLGGLRNEYYRHSFNPPEGVR